MAHHFLPVMYFLYILQGEISGKYYIGSTEDVPTRIAQHNAGKVRSTRSYRPWKLIYTEEFSTRSEALRRELQIKSWKNPDYMIHTLGLNPPTG